MPARSSTPIRLRDLEVQGVSRTKVRRMVGRGELVELGRGLYAYASFEPTEHHGLAVIAARVPSAVVCLLSALAFHELTTEQPHELWIALPPKTWRPRVEWPPLRVVTFSGAHFHEGVEHHKLEGIDVKVYSVAKTVIDCFRFRNKIGLEVALEALRDALRKRLIRPGELIELAQRQRIATAFRPYLEALA
jgi:predicted transcriptional regulator of viral defense system